MKQILIIAAALLMLNFSANAQTKKNDKISEVKFDVSMHCENCKQKIEKNIPFEKGVKDLEVNLNDKTVLVKFDNKKTDAEKIKAAIEKLGYTTTLASNQTSQSKCCAGKAEGKSCANKTTCSKSCSKQTAEKTCSGKAAGKCCSDKAAAKTCIKKVANAKEESK
jgi:copper chaperone CopZ